jgi:hypothetical protein
MVFRLDATAGLFATRSVRPLVNRRATEPAVLEMHFMIVSREAKAFS